MGNKKRFFNAVGLAGLLLTVVGVGQAQASVVLFNSQNFASTANYWSGYELQGQPTSNPVSPNSLGWQASISDVANPPYPVAGITSNPSVPSQQAVIVESVNIGASDYGLWYPEQNLTTPFTPNAVNGTNHVDVSWSESYLTSTGDPFFGVWVNDNGSHVALAGIDATLGLLMVEKPSGFAYLPGSDFQGAPSTFYNLEMDLNYTSQTYGIYVNGSLVDTESFANSAIQFTDADITTLPVGGGVADGYGYFDNYLVQAVPEPAGLSLLVAGSILLLKRWRTDKRTALLSK